MSGERVEILEDGDGVRRVLALSHESLGGEPLLAHLRRADAGATDDVPLPVAILNVPNVS